MGGPINPSANNLLSRSTNYKINQWDNAVPMEEGEPRGLIIYRKRINLRRFNEVESFDLRGSNNAAENRREHTPLADNRGGSSWFDVKHVLMSTRFGHAAQKYLQKDPGLVTRDYFDGSLSATIARVLLHRVEIVFNGFQEISFKFQFFTRFSLVQLKNSLV